MIADEAPKVFLTSGLSLPLLYGRSLLSASYLASAGILQIEHGKKLDYYNGLFKTRKAHARSKLESSSQKGSNLYAP